MNKWGFVFEGIRRWPVINLVTLIYRYSYLVSLEVVVGYRKLISFKGTLDQFKCITIETRYHVRIAELLIRSLQSQVAQFVRKTRTMLKIFHFSGDHQFFQIPRRIKSLYDRGEKLFIYWSGRHNLGLGRKFQQISWPGKQPGCISPGNLDRV